MIFEDKVKQFYRDYTGEDLTDTDAIGITAPNIPIENRNESLKASATAIAIIEGLPKVQKYFDSIGSSNVILSKNNEELGSLITGLAKGVKPKSYFKEKEPVFGPSLGYLNSPENRTSTFIDNRKEDARTFGRSLQRDSTTIQSTVSPIGNINNVARQINEELGISKLTSHLAYEEDPNFDPLKFVQDEGMEQYADSFLYTFNAQQAYDLKAFIQVQEETLQLQANNPIMAFLGSTTALITDPTNYFALLPKLKTILGSTAAALGLVGGVTAAQEAVLQQADPTRTFEESLATVAGASVIGAGFGYAKATTLFREETLANLVDKYKNRFQSNFEGKLDPEMIKEMKAAGYKGKDQEIFEQFESDLGDTIKDLTGDFDAFLSKTKDTDLTEQLEGGFMGEMVRRMSNKLSPAGRIKDSIFNSARLYGYFSNSSTSSTKLEASGLGFARPIASEVERVVIEMRVLADNYSLLDKKYFRTGELNQHQAYALIKERATTGKSTGYDAVDSMGDQIKDVLHRFRVEADSEDVFTYSTEFKTKTGEEYFPGQIDKNKLSYDAQVAHNVEAKLKGLQEEVKHANQRISEAEHKAMFKEGIENSTKDNQDAFFSIGTSKYRSQRLIDDEFWEFKASKDKLTGKSKEEIGTIKKALKEKDWQTLRQFDDIFEEWSEKAFKVYKKRIKDFTDSKATKILDEYATANDTATWGSDQKIGANNNRTKRSKYLLPSRILSDIENNDILNVMNRYGRQMGTSIAFKKAYGVNNAQDVYEKVTKAIRKEAKELKSKNNEKLSKKESEKKNAEIDLEVQKIEENIKIDLEMKTGQYGREVDYNGMSQTIMRNLKVAIAYRLGMASISQLPEAALALSHRMAKSQLKNIGKFADDVKGLDIDVRDLETFGVHSEINTQRNSISRAGIDENGLDTSNSKLERGLKTGLYYILKATGMIDLTKVIHTSVAEITINNIAAIGTKLLRKTKLSSGDAEKLRNMKMPEPVAKKIAQLIEKYGVKRDTGYFDPQIHKWSLDERRLLSVVMTEIQKISPIPRPEAMPAFLSTNLGSLIFAFQSFIFSATQQQLAYRGQDFHRNPTMHATNLILQIAGAGAAIVLKDTARGNDFTERLENPDQLALQMVGYSGIMGVLGDGGMALYNTVTGRHEDAFIRQFAPGYSTIGGIQALSQGIREGQVSEQQFNKIMGMTGLGSFLYTAALTNWLAKEVGE